MTPADLARANAIALELKKDSLRQNQDGTWKIVLTVQAIDMDRRLTHAMPGTRYQAVLVEIDENEMPVPQAEKEKSVTSRTMPATPRPKDKPAGAKRDWRDLPAVEQAGIRCADPIFRSFLRDECGFDVHSLTAAEIVVRQLCKVESRKEFNTDPLARSRWHGLDDQFLAWRYADA